MTEGTYLRLRQYLMIAKYAEDIAKDVLRDLGDKGTIISQRNHLLSKQSFVILGLGARH